MNLVFAAPLLGVCFYVVLETWFPSEIKKEENMNELPAKSGKKKV